jgi:MarR family transcriptional regulator for hemolysin
MSKSKFKKLRFVMSSDQVRESNFLFEFFDCARAIRRHLEIRLAARHDGLTFGDAQVLLAIASEPRREQGCVATRLRVGRATATEAINRLEKFGFVQRLPDPKDRRARCVDLTTKGTYVSNVIIAEVARMEQPFIANLTSEERSEMHAALLAMRERLILNNT